MHVGRSPDERELAREESRSNVGWDPLTAIRNVFKSPAATTAIFGPAAGVISAVATAAIINQSRKPSGPRQERGGKEKAVAAAPAAPASPSAAPAAPDSSTDAPAAAPSAVSGYGRRKQRGSVMGLASYTDEYVASLIHKETDTDKKKRMIFSHERAKKLRTSSGMSGLSEVDEAVGELFARMPVDGGSNPSLDKSHITAICKRIAEKRAAARDGDGARPTQEDYSSARKLLAAYVQINGVATPGLKVAKGRP